MLKKTILIQPNCIDPLYYFGQVAWKRKRFEVAVVILEKITKIDSRLMYFYYELNESLNSIGKSEKAIMYLRKQKKLQKEDEKLIDSFIHLGV